MTANEGGSRLTASVSPAPREGSAELGFDLIRAKDPFTLVIFGASGDLAKRKLIPALYHLQESGYLADRYAVIKTQIPTALLMLIVNTVLMYVLAFRH